MPTFTYTGKQTSREKIDGKEIVFIPGKKYELSSASKRVGSLLAQKLLKFSGTQTDDSEKTASETSKSEKSTSSNKKVSSSKTSKNK